MRVYKAHSGQFYAIGSGVRYTNADCYSKGFKTRKEANQYIERLKGRAEELKLNFWEAHKLPEFFPDNGRSSKYIPHYLVGDKLRKVFKTLNQLEFIES